MTPRQRRTHLLAWLILAPLTLAALFFALSSTPTHTSARDWPAEAAP